MEIEMKNLNLTSLSLIFLLILIASTGCQSARFGARERAETVEIPNAVDVVDVSGLVREPQTVEIGAGGLTLKKSLVRAGGVQATKPATGLMGITTARTKLPFVHLQRRS